jgi:hypothetical protein
MTCNHCRKSFAGSAFRCPHCGEPSPAAAGVYRSSTVLVSASGGERVYRSVEEIPAPLRTRLLKSTNGRNSATILIADRRGRQEIARAVRNLPGSAQRRFLQALLGAEGSGVAPGWPAPRRRRAIAAAILLLSLALVLVAFLYRP